ncbi:TonB-dependent receptor [Pelagibacteraceae bacterium]|nr:TonB-dependent receptor [Pelagibacteraceae bacterium]
MQKLLFLFCLFIFNISAQEKLGTVDVIGSSPLPGIMIERKDIPNSSQKITSTDIKENLSKTIIDLMNENLAGVSVKDLQNGAFQKNIDYRGFTASPLLGESQGLAVYLDGIRINESFGDTVQWELVPENAIKQIDLMSSNPAFGLNALGGSLALTTKKGLDFKNIEFVDTINKFGSFNFASQLMEYGYGTDTFGTYTSIELEKDGGWRDHSDGEISRFFTNYGFERDNFDLNFTFLGGNTDLNGNGVSPIELLQKNRKAVFTWPDKTSNKMSLFYGTSNFYTNNDKIISSNFYHKKLYRTTYNADEMDAEECAEDSAADATELKTDYGFDDAPLCGDDNSAGDYGIILDQYGNAIESNDNIRKYGLLNQTFTTTTTMGGALQYDTFLNLYDNAHKFALGFSYDQAETFFRSQGFLGTLTTERTVTPLYASNGNPIELVSEQEHAGNGNDPGTKKRGDVGPAEVTGKLNIYGLYASDNFNYNEKLTFNNAFRANLAFVELIDNFKTPTYTRTAFINGDHRYFRVNPSLGFVYDYNNKFSIIANYREANRVPSPVELSCADPAAPCRLPNAFVADPPLEQVITKGTELGARGSFSSNNYTTNWNTIGHFSQNSEDILFVSSGTGLSSGYFKNFGKTNRLGLDMSIKISRNNKVGFKSSLINYSFLKATFQSAHTLPAANHPNGSNDIEAGDIIPGMPLHKINAKTTYGFNNDLDISLGLLGSTGVFLRGDESNQLNKTSPYLVFNLESRFQPHKNFSLFARIDNILDNKYETMGVLGEASSSEVNVPISELGDTGTGDTAIGALDPNFLSPGQPTSFFVGASIKW